MELETLQTYAYDLRTKHALRDEQAQAMSDMYKLNWQERSDLEAKFAHMKVTLSPSPRNKTKAAVRLMTATHPVVDVPDDLQTKIGPDIGNRIERWADQVIRQSSRIRGNPVETDIVTSAILYDEFFITVNSTAAMLQMEGSRAVKERNKKVYQRTPFLLSVHNPIGCYADHDGISMTAFARCVTMTPSQIIAKFGSKGETAINAKSDKRQATNVLGTHKVWTMWTLDWYACWIEGSTEPIHNYAHNLPVIPVVHSIVDGSRDLFDKPEDQREPFLYTIWKSGTWNRENLFLSGMSTTGAMSLWPQVAFMSDDRKYPDIDPSVPFGVFHLRQGEQLQTWNRNLIDPGLHTLWQEMQRLGTESTLYDQVMGAPLGPGASYSETALLNQAGRLPLIGPQEKSGWGMGDAIRIAAMLYKDEGSWPNTGYSELLDPQEVPDDLEVTVTLDVALPQDKLGNANVFQIMDGKMPHEWLVENVLGEKNPQDITRKLMDEQARKAMFEMWLQDKAMKMQAAQQMELAQMQQAMAPQQPPVPPQGVPPQAMQGPPGIEDAALFAQQPPEDLAALQGMPNELTQGGALMPPGEGEEIA